MKTWYELTFEEKQQMLDTYEFLLNFGHTKNQLPMAQMDDYNKMIIGDDIIVMLGVMVVSNTVLTHFNNIEFFYDEG